MAELNGTEHSAEMLPGEKSQYDIFVDDELVFSKQSAGRWPQLPEILAKLPS